VRRSDGAIVGGIELSRIARGNFRSAYLGYQIGGPHARQGLMTEALRIAVTDAFGRLKLHRLEANIQPGNVASIRLVRRLGFTREGFSRAYLKIGGRWRDHERWAILKPHWRPSRAATRAHQTPRHREEDSR
jgi:ribosomal-protein-alanine N-acetyltransferase